MSRSRTTRCPISPVPGERLGRFEIVERLIAGGMAELFRARRCGPGHSDVVVKCLRPDIRPVVAHARALLSEAEILGMVSHPNVVRLFEVGEQRGRRYLVLEHLDGPSVAQILALLARPRIPIPAGVAAYIAREICLALEAVHGQRGPDGERLNVVHRDVTPENLMTTTSGEVKLIDFGIATWSGAHVGARRGSRIYGKPGYMAPEQILDAAIDGRTDLFALGAVLYEMLTLEPVFLVEDDGTTIERVLQREIPPPSTLRSAVSPELDRIVAKALERPPSRRYQRAAEMAADLSAVVEACDVGPDEVAAFAKMFRRVETARSSPVRMVA